MTAISFLFSLIHASVYGALQKKQGDEKKETPAVAADRPSDKEEKQEEEKEKGVSVLKTQPPQCSRNLIGTAGAPPGINKRSQYAPPVPKSRIRFHWPGPTCN